MKSSAEFLEQLRKSEKIIVGVTRMDGEVKFVTNAIPIKPNKPDDPILIVDNRNYIKFTNTGAATSFMPPEEAPDGSHGALSVLI